MDYVLRQLEGFDGYTARVCDLDPSPLPMKRSRVFFLGSKNRKFTAMAWHDASSLAQPGTALLVLWLSWF